MQRSASRSGFNPTPILLKMCTAWSRARREGCIPFRKDLDPRDLGQDLANICILERRSDFDFRIRTSGHNISDQIGMELRGMPGVSLIAPQYRQTVTDLFVDCVENRCGIEMGVIGLATEQSGHILMLPMRGPEGEIDRIICAIDAGEPLCPPNRFAIASIATIPLGKVADILANAPERPKGFDPVVLQGGGMTSETTPSRPNLKLVG